MIPQKLLFLYPFITESMKKGLFVTVMMALLSTAGVKAQSEASASIGADLISKYIWRGMELGQVSIQPFASIDYKGLSFFASGNIGVSDNMDAEEIDLTLAYTVKGLSFGIVDYWNNDAENRYFYYNAHGTAHQFEGFVAYDFGPLKASWQTMFAGDDGLNKSGDRAYSSYVELEAPFSLRSFDCTATCGFVPYATTLYETEGFAVTNLGLKAAKNIPVTDKFSLPVFAQVVGNPCTQRAYLIFGLTLSGNL